MRDFILHFLAIAVLVGAVGSFLYPDYQRGLEMFCADRAAGVPFFKALRDALVAAVRTLFQ